MSSGETTTSDDSFKALAELLDDQHRAGILEGLRIGAEIARDRGNQQPDSQFQNFYDQTFYKMAASKMAGAIASAIDARRKEMGA